jgi:hypothetical protein
VIVAGMREPVYAHCAGASTKPLATVTSHPEGDGGWIWYVGGGIAEDGITLSAEALVRQARTRLPALFPGADFSCARWAAFAVDRAEYGGEAGRRPGDAVVRDCGPALVVWPTKLALAPRLADLVLERVAARLGRAEGRAAIVPAALSDLARPRVAAPPWQRVTQWS